MNSNNNKYKSAVRDKLFGSSPNINLFEKKTQKKIKTERYNIGYKINSLEFSKIFEQAIVHNKNEIKEKFTKQIQRLVKVFDLQYELASHHMGLIVHGNGLGINISPVMRILFPCFHKSNVNLFSALHLTKNGLWGMARPLIRQSFESLIIAKYCSVNHQSDVYDRWIDGINLTFTNAVLNKIKKPDTTEFKEFWKIMSQYTHSSIYASQPDFKIDSQTDDYFEDTSLNLVFIEMMMECKYHLLISHMITSSMRYYQSYYGDGERVKELKRSLKSRYSEFKKSMGSGGKSLIKDYRSSWIIKT